MASQGEGQEGERAGGAPPLARGFNAEPDYDANETGLFDNKTLGFRALEKAFYDHHATRAGIAGTPEAGLRPVGAVVDGVGNNTPARRAGLQVNDVITAVDGQAVKSARDLLRLLFAGVMLWPCAGAHRRFPPRQ